MSPRPNEYVVNLIVRCRLVVNHSVKYPNPDLDQHIDVLKGVLLRQPEGSEQFLNAMEEMARLYDARYTLFHQDIDRDEAIDLRRECARVSSTDSARHLEALHRLSTALQARSFPERLLYDHIIQEPTSHRQSYTEDDLDEIITTQKAALAICDPNHRLHAPLTGQLGSAMLHRVNSLTELQHSIQLLRCAQVLWPSCAAERLPVLKNLACALSSATGASEKVGATEEMLELVWVHRELIGTYPHLTTRVDSLQEIAKHLSSLCCPPLNRVELIPSLRRTADELTQVGHDSTLYKATANALQYNAEQLVSCLPNSTIACQSKSIQFSRRTTCLSIPRDRFPHILRAVRPDGTLPIHPEKFTPRFLYFADTDLQLDELDGVICSYLDYLATHPDSEPDDTTRRLYLNLGALFRYRYVNQREKGDLDAAIEYHQAAWQLTDSRHHDFRMLSRNLEYAYRERYNLCGDIMEYTRSLKLGMWPMDDGLIAEGPQLLPTPMGSLPPLTPRQLASTTQLRDSKIEYHRDMIAKSASPSRVLYVELASSLTEKFTSNCLADNLDAHEILQLLDQIDITELHPAERPTTPPNRTMVYSSWYRRTGEEQHLAAAVAHLSTGTIADRMQVLWERYMRSGDLSDLERAIGIGRQVRGSFSLGDAGDRGYYRIPLALCLLSRYENEGDPADIEEVITLPHAPPADLAEAYLLRYERYGREEDLSYAFRVGEFEQCPDDDVDDVDELDGDALHDATGDTLFASNRRAVVHCGTLLAKRALDGPTATDVMLLASIILSKVENCCVFTLKADILHCRAALLMKTKPVLGEVEDAIIAARSAIETTTETDVRRPRLYALLGEAYHKRYLLSAEIGDIEASIAALRICLAGVSLSNPRWADYKLALGESLSLLSRAKPEPTLTAQAIDAFRDVAQASASSLRTRYAGGLSWARTAVEHDREDALRAYDIVMEIFPQFASLGLDVRSRHESLIRSGALGVASAAAACAIQANNLLKAVEFLEHGRSVFWRRAMQLRNPMSTLAESEPDLARRLTELARDLNISGFHARTEDDSKAREAFIIREGPKRRALVEEWEKLVKDARQVKGCEDLLQLPSYDRLAEATSSSLVILLVATEDSGYAIILEGSKLPPKCLPLAPVTSRRVSEWVDRLRVTLKQANREAREVFTPEDRYSGPSRQRNEQHEEATLIRLLGIMWRDIVHPILDFMGLEKGTQVCLRQGCFG